MAITATDRKRVEEITQLLEDEGAVITDVDISGRPDAVRFSIDGELPSFVNE
jgi:hypothetical protein